MLFLLFALIHENTLSQCYRYIIETLFYRIITKNKTKTRERFCNLYLSELGTKLIDDKREEEKVNVYEIKFQSTSSRTSAL
jgi:hypothetical protein